MKTHKTITLLTTWACALACMSLLGGCTAPAQPSPSATPAASTAPASPAPTQAPQATATVQPTVQPTATAQAQGALLPDALPLEFTFSSGAGGWGTVLTLQPDGTFTGSYHDSEMGDRDEARYPNGTVYMCTFSGRFEDIRQVDDHTYALTLGKVATEKSKDETWIQDGIRYIAADPYGLETGKSFLLYTPETPLSHLPDDFLSWWPLRFSQDGSTSSTLSCYGLYNREANYGFFTYES